ncbi:hypothetical protein ACFFWE_11805 [Sphaerisporangium melleum]|nr:hypothetical protein [Sphaerisporangium melleum]
MTSIFVAVGLAVTGLVPLAVLSSRVVVAARSLTREIERANDRLAPAESRFKALIGTSRRAQG